MTPSHKLAALVAVALLPTAAFADVRGGGERVTANVTLDRAVDETTDIWDELAFEEFTLNSQSNIIVTACSDVDNPGGSIANTYNFTLALDSTAPGTNGSAERTIDDLYDDPAKDDPDVVHVCSTRHFENVAAGTHRISWLGAKANGAMADTTVFDSSMTMGAFNGDLL